MSNLGIAQSEITGASSSGSGTTVNFRGVWSNVTAYATNDLVTRKGSVWIAVTGNTGNDPYLDNGTNWTLFAEGFNYAGTWLVGTSYNFFDVVTFNNSFYLSVLAGSQTNLGNNPQTDNGTHWVLLDQGFNFRGAWNVGATYNPYDVVTFQSSTYMNILQVTGGAGPASDTAHWTLLAAAGAVAPRATFVFNMPSAPITNVSLTTNVVTLSVVNTFTSQGEGTGQGQVNTIYITGLTGASFLNNQVLTIVTISPTTITANFTHANYPSTADSGTATLSIPINGVFWTTGATGSSVQLAPTFEVSRIQCGQATRIELYSGSSFRTSDAGRPATTQPTQFTQHGVILDLNLDGSIAPFSSWVLSPLAYGANDEFDALPSANISAAFTNISGAPTTNSFSVTFTWTTEESGGVNSPNADQYVLGTTDPTNLPAAVANPTAYFGVDTAPGTAGSLDDEFAGATLNLGRWTFVNQGGATSVVKNSILDLHDPTTSAADNFRVIVQPVPAAPYEVTVKILPSATVPSGGTLTGATPNFLSPGGIAITDGTTAANKMIYFGFNYNQANFPANPQLLVVNRYTNFTTFSATVANLAWVWQPGHWMYLRYHDDSVNVQFSWSMDGVVFHQLFQESRTAFLTPAQVGLGLENVNATILCDLSCDWFRRTV